MAWASGLCLISIFLIILNMVSSAIWNYVSPTALQEGWIQLRILEYSKSRTGIIPNSARREVLNFSFMGSGSHAKVLEHGASEHEF